jgi:hypothetical protein
MRLVQVYRPTPWCGAVGARVDAASRIADLIDREITRTLARDARVAFRLTDLLSNLERRRESSSFFRAIFPKRSRRA